MNLFYLAYKNVFRHKKRSILTGITVIVGVAFFSFIDSMNRGLAEESYRNVREFETGYFQFNTQQYFKDKEDFPIEQAFDPKEIIAHIPEGQVYTTRSYFKTEVNVYEDPFPQSGTFQLVGVVVDPKRDKDVFKISQYMFKGSFIDENTPKNSVVIGSILADKIGADVGYEMTFNMRTKEGTEQVVDATIVGIFSTPTGKLNGKFAYFSNDLMDEAMELNGEVSSLVFALGELNPESEYSQLMSQLEGHLPKGVQAYRWFEIVEDLIAFVKFKDTVTYFIALLIFIITFVGISNTMLMSVNERSFEVGALMSLGMKRSELLRLFSYEGFFIGLMGAILGFFLGLLLNTWLIYVGFKVDALDKGTLDIPYRISSNLRGTWNFLGMFFAMGIAVVVSSFSSFIATRKFVKKKIVDCLRGI